MRFIARAVVSLLALAAPAAAETEVDVELVLAVDVSYSINRDEQDIQRVGYAAAFDDPRVIAAITGGLHGRVAVSYVEWAEYNFQRVVVPWTVIDGQKAAMRFAEALRSAPVRRSGATSISAAILYSIEHLEQNDVAAIRQVIDVSGDGANTSGPGVALARDIAAARGITINGLPLLMGAGAEEVDLASYYADCVIGGPGAFSHPAASWREFGEAIREKLVLELADGYARVVPVADGLGRKEPRADCFIGEKLDREKYLRNLNNWTNGSERWIPSEKMWPSLE